MYRGALVLVFVSAVVVGCGKKSDPTVESGPPTFSETDPERTLTWLAEQQNALDAAQDKDSDGKMKALAESMKGRTFAWTTTLDEINSNKTYAVNGWTIHTDAPEPPSEETRKRRYALVCKPFEPGVPIPDKAPFVRKQELGFPSGGGNWHNTAALGMDVKLSGTVSAVQLHRNSWVTGFGVKDRVVHTEIAFTLHVTGGAVTPVP